jgi:hypothetical protein
MLAWEAVMADGDKDLEEAKRIMARLVNMPPKPQESIKLGAKAKAAKKKPRQKD